MAVSRPYGFEIDFGRNAISGSAAWFFVIVLKFIFTSICEIRIYKKKFLNTKKVSMVYLFRSLVVKFVLYEILCHILIIKRYHIKDTTHQMGLFIWLIWYKLYQMAHIWPLANFRMYNHYRLCCIACAWNKLLTLYFQALSLNLSISLTSNHGNINMLKQVPRNNK